MKKIFQQSGSLIMASLVLFSTMSFAVEKHFCGKILIDQAVFSEVEPCCSAMHENSSEEGIDENSCCNEKNISVEGQDELKISFDHLDLSQQAFLASFAFTFLNLFEGLPEQVVPFKDYSPPLLLHDIPVLNQSFLI